MTIAVALRRKATKQTNKQTKLLHSLLIAKHNYHKQVPIFMYFLFHQLDINRSFVLSIFIIILFSGHQMLSKFKACWRLISNISLSEPISYNVVSSAYKSTDQVESPINRGKSQIKFKKNNRGP